MSKRHVFISLIFSLLASTAPSLAFGAGGFSGSGGGGGVVCFNSAARAAEADVWLKNNKALPDSLLKQAHINVLEAWEMKQQGQTLWPEAQGAKWPELLSDVESVVRADFPLFMYRLDQVGDWSKIQSWADVEDLSFLDDATPVKPIPAECRRVQIAVRYSDGNNRLGDGPPGERPTVRVVFAKRYFDQLTEIEKAMLVFHEKLYMLAQSFGYQTSDWLRGFIRIFFDSDAANMLGQPGHIIGNDALFKIKTALIERFGDYIQYFAAMDVGVQGKPFTSEHHFATFFAMNKRLRGRMHECLKRAEPEPCRQKIMDPAALQDELTPEEAYLYFVYHGLEMSLQKVNADQVMDPVGKDPANFERAMHVTCDAVEYFRPRFALPKVIEKAHGYCELWKKNAATHSSISSRR